MIRRRLLTIGHSYCVDVNRRLAHELARAGGWDVTVVGPSRLRGDFRVHTLEAASTEPIRLQPMSVYASRKSHTLVYGWSLRALLRQPWDLVHCWEEPYVASAAQVAAWTPARVPLVMATFQNIDKRYPPPFRWFERYVLDRADGLVAFGHTAAEVAAVRGFPTTRTRVIPPGVDTTQFAPNPQARARVRAALGWTTDVPVVGFVGRFVPEKGLPLLMEVLGSLRQPWRALFVGRGPLEPAIRRWARSFGDRVALAPSVGHDGVGDWLNAMDVLCAPSQTTTRWREQFGRMLIEAFAVGVPVVASDGGEIPHVVGEAGVLVAERDLVGWARAIGALLDDPKRRAALGQSGRDLAVTRYDWRVVARQHSAFFHTVIDGSPVRLGRPAQAVRGAGA